MLHVVAEQIQLDLVVAGSPPGAMAVSVIFSRPALKQEAREHWSSMLASA
jgi:hypothetical protein